MIWPAMTFITTHPIIIKYARGRIRFDVQFNISFYTIGNWKKFGATTEGYLTLKWEIDGRKTWTFWNTATKLNLIFGVKENSYDQTIKT